MTQWVSIEPYDPKSENPEPESTSLKLMNWRIDKEIDINDLKTNI